MIKEEEHVILNIDSDPDGQQLMEVIFKECLQEENILAAETVVDAKEILRDHRPRLVMLNYDVGDEVMEQFLGEFHEPTSPWHDIPLIVVSAHDLSDVRRACASFGVDAFIAKPFTLREFRDTVEKVLELHS